MRSTRIRKERVLGPDFVSIDNIDDYRSEVKISTSPSSSPNGRAVASSAERRAVSLPSMSSFTVPDAPTFRPTAEEFADPGSYVRSIRFTAEQYGIVKIVPPPGWSPPCTIAARRASNIKYATRLQAVHRLAFSDPWPDGAEYTFSDYEAAAVRAKEMGFPFLVPPGTMSGSSSSGDGGCCAGAPTSSEGGDVKPKASPALPSAFMQAARRYADALYASGPAVYPGTDIPTSPWARMAPAVERAYWSMFEAGAATARGAPPAPPLFVEYGNDQDTRVVGSGFPLHPSVAAAARGGNDAMRPRPVALPARVEPRFDDPHYYAETGWNLNNIAFTESSVLRHIDEELAGVNAPWLYLGSIFASFAYHNEDHYLYSLNYMHYGEGKTWYGIPALYTSEFESALRACVAVQRGGVRTDGRELLYDLLSIAPPSALVARGVPVFRIFQEPGEFVLTLPQAYHSGFSHGFNVAEATNWALADWLPFGARAVERYRRAALEARPLVFSHEALVMALARNSAAARVAGGSCTTTCCADDDDGAVVTRALCALLGAEQREREALASDGVIAWVRLPPQGRADDRLECVKCHHVCYFSAVVCPCASALRKVACLRHAAQLCVCPPSSKVCVYWHDIHELQALAAALGAPVVPPVTAGPAMLTSDT